MKYLTLALFLCLASCSAQKYTGLIYRHDEPANIDPAISKMNEFNVSIKFLLEEKDWDKQQHLKADILNDFPDYGAAVLYQDGALYGEYLLKEFLSRLSYNEFREFLVESIDMEKKFFTIRLKR